MSGALPSSNIACIQAAFYDGWRHGLEGCIIGCPFLRGTDEHMAWYKGLDFGLRQIKEQGEEAGKLN